MNEQLRGAAALSHLGVIRVEGEDAAKFLHGQLTQDFSLLGPAEARLAALCTAKGRMQASFIGFKPRSDLVLLVCSRDILAPTLKRLSMFVLRAKARLTDASSEFALWGLAGQDAIESVAARALPAWARAEFPLKTAAAGDAGADTSSLIGLYPADGVARALCVVPAGAGAPVAAPLDQAMDEKVWQWSEVRSGIATLTAPVVEAFVPQMLNYESVGGVNFKKGCYPGQEVVARSQFRGTLKRRAYLVHAEAPLQVGQEVFHAADAEQPCGTVAQAAAAPSGGWDAIVSMQVAAADGGRLNAGTAEGALLALQPLPYPLLEDI